MSYLIRGGMVVDGTGREPRRADVLVRGDRIVQVSEEIEPGLGMEVLDASAHSIAPGFIDIHSHSDYTLAIDPRAVSALHQGVTLEVVGNCGHGCFPVRDRTLARRAIYGHSDAYNAFAEDASKYFELLDGRRPAVNVLSLVPHGQLRLSTVGLSDASSSLHQKDEMLRLLDEAMVAGAWGLSTGLEYAAERGASASEITQLCSVVAEAGGLYATHTRFRNEGSVLGIKEALDVCRLTGVRLQISHLIPRGGYEDAQLCIALVDAARSEGLDVAFDMHTRLHGFTYLSVGLPPEALSGSVEEVAAKLSSRAFRDEVSSYRGMFNFQQDADRIILTTGSAEYSGLSLAAISQLRNQTPSDAAFDLLLASVHNLAALTVSLPTYSVDQQLLAFEHALCMPASDATTLAPDGVLAESYFPGAYGWAAWFIRFLSQECRVLTLEEAVRRLTTLPASRLGILDRGAIQEGMFADLAVFTPAEVSEHRTPGTESLATGMRHVLVNGIPALVDGELTGSRTGRVLRH